jgi:predicted AlkP superfamily pyrophosphatase or phosphodiesterase
MSFSYPGGRAKALVIGIDGLRWDRIADAPAPRLRALMRDGLFAPSLLVPGHGAETVSGPGWSTVASGVWPAKHGVLDNSFTGRRYDEHPDFLTLLKRANPALSTFAALNWPPLTDEGTFGPEIDQLFRGDGEEHGYYTEDERMTKASAAVLRDEDPDAGFVYLSCIDAAGHGWGAGSKEYLAAVAAADTWIGELLDAVAARRTYRLERWLILLTTDHGHTNAGGHGGYTDAEARTFVIAHGPEVAPGRRADVRLVDVAPTVLRHLGVAVPDRLDGRAIV